MTKPTDPLRQILLAGLAELRISGELEAPLADLCHLLARWAARMNLTGHRTPEAIARRLVLDALALAAVLPARPPESLADIGSGAGFPGIPIALLWPQCRVTLIEPRERRHHFQRAAIRMLGLPNIEAIRGRAEELDPVPHQIAVAQAVADASLALRWMAPWVEPGGWLALARSQAFPPVDPPPGFEEARSTPYRAPLEGADRVLWTARAVGGRRGGPCDT